MALNHCSQAGIEPLNPQWLETAFHPMTVPHAAVYALDETA